MISQINCGRRTMKRFLGTIFLLLFLASTVFACLGCGGEKNGDEEGGVQGIPTAGERQQQMDEVLGE